MVGVLLLALAVQQPDVVARVDRERVEVGDTIVLTVTAEVPGNETVELDRDPPHRGFQLRSTSQSSVFNVRGTVGTRTSTWQYVLRAMNPGRTQVGPVLVRVGSELIEAPAIEVEVLSVDRESEAALAARVQRIATRAAGPDGSDDVIVSVMPSRDTIVLGEQLDLVVVAWFPRDIRTRLRTRPTLTPPEVQGAWTYAQTAALGVAATRRVADRSYDQFVHHQVAFPLTAGRFEVGPATVSYNLPLRMSILSREVGQEIQSRPIVVTVLPQPVEGRPSAFEGAAATDLSFNVTVDTSGIGLGSAGTIAATVTGRGNVALWPEPEFAWPPGARVYPGRTDVEIVPEAGVIGGTKTFTYMMVPDSVGDFLVPLATFRYFDLGTGRYRELQSQAFDLVTTVASPPSSPGAVPRLVLAVSTGEPVIQRLWNSIPPWAILVIVLTPPLLVAVRLGMKTGPWGRVRGRNTKGQRDTLADLAATFEAVVARLVPPDQIFDPHALEAALRGAGVEAPVAAHASRVRERLRHAEYGPDGVLDRNELAAEVREVLRALPGSSVRRRTAVGAIGVMTVIVTAGSVSAQSAERLYEMGYYRAAADSFAGRAHREPNDPVHWVNLGAAHVALEAAPSARAAWVRAARLAPRSSPVKQVLSTLAPIDPESRRLLFVSPITPIEGAIAAVALWVVGWLVALFGARRRFTVPVLVLALALGLTAWYLHDRYRQPVGVVLHDGTRLRVAPYGSAVATRELGSDVAVQIRRQDGPWRLVVRGVNTGWVLAEELARF